MYKVLTGAQMYSVRTLTQTQEGLDATLKALKEMGYTLSEEELLRCFGVSSCCLSTPNGTLQAQES